MNKKQIFLLIATAVIVGFVNSSYYNFTGYFAAKNGLKYFRSPLSQYDLSNVIAPRIKQVLEGRLVVSDTDTYEYRNVPPIWMPLSPLFYFPFTLFSASIDTTLRVSDTIFPIIFFFLFFILYYHVSNGKKWISFCFAVLTSLYPYYSIHIPPPNLDYLKIFLNSFNPLSDVFISHEIIRRESFAPGLITLFLGLIFSYLTVTKNSIKYAVTGGLFYALNAYTYPFHFLYLSASLGILFITLCFAKNKKAIINLLILFLSAAIFLIPFVLLQLQLRSLPQYQDVFQRFGVEVGNGFRWWHWQRYLWNTLLAILVLVIGKLIKKKNESYFIASLLLSTIPLMNMQLIFGYSVQTDHWPSRDFLWGLGLAYFFIAGALSQYLATKNRLWKFARLVVPPLLLVALAINTLKYNYAEAKKNYGLFTYPPTTIEMIEWLKKNTPADSVVMTPSLVNNYIIPLYTNDRIFIPKGLSSMAPEEEILERLFFTYKIYNVNNDYLGSIINPKADLNFALKDDKFNFDGSEKNGVLYLFSDKYVKNGLTTYTVPTGLGFRSIPEEKYETILNNYNDFVFDRANLKKYRVDFLLYGPQEKKITQVNLAAYPFLKKIYNRNGLEVYQVVADSTKL